MLSWYRVAVAGVRGHHPSTLDLFVIGKTQVRFANSSSSDIQIPAFLFQGFAMKYGVLVQQETGMTWWCARKSLAPASGPVIDHPPHQTTLVRSHSLEAHTAGIDLPPLRPLFGTRRIRQAWFHSVRRTDGFFLPISWQQSSPLTPGQFQVKFARNIGDGGLYLPFQARVLALELLFYLVRRFGNQLLENMPWNISPATEIYRKNRIVFGAPDQV